MKEIDIKINFSIWYVWKLLSLVILHFVGKPYKYFYTGNPVKKNLFAISN